MNWLSEHWVEILAVWGAVCVIADFITGTLTKNTKKDDEVWAKIKNGINSVISIAPKKK